METMSSMTLYDLMAEDLGVWVNIDERFGINLQIEDENGEVILDEEHVNKCAADSFADFCRNYLNSYDRARARSMKS